MDDFLLNYKAGPNWKKLGPQDSPVAEHFAWVRGQHAAGAIRLAGPYLDLPGALALVRARSADEVAALCASDPAIQAGFFVVESVRPLKLMVGTGEQP